MSVTSRPARPARTPRRAAEPTPPPRPREVLAAPLVAFVTLIVALAATDAAGVRFRDPDHVAAQYLVLVGVAVALLVWLDIAVRAARSEGTRWPSRAAMTDVRRTRWTTQRMLAAGAALISFYVSYLAYRNLKAMVPLLRPGDLFDRELADLERSALGGHDPAAILHTLLGTGVMTHVLSAIYASFIVFLPLSLAVALVFSRTLTTSLFFATALSLNWLIGAGSYFVLPALGPIYADPLAFADLPHSHVTDLQQMLLDDRIGFLHDPATGTPQAIAAFASLHIAMSFTALAAAHVLDLGRRLKIGLWVWLAVTVVSTVYFGWHYVVDDIAGIAIGAVSLLVARALTAYDVAGSRRAAPA